MHLLTTWQLATRDLRTDSPEAMLARAAGPAADPTALAAAAVAYRARLAAALPHNLALVGTDVVGHNLDFSRAEAARAVRVAADLLDTDRPTATPVTATPAGTPSRHTRTRSGRTRSSRGELLPA